MNFKYLFETMLYNRYRYLQTFCLFNVISLSSVMGNEEVKNMSENDCSKDVKFGYPNGKQSIMPIFRIDFISATDMVFIISRTPTMRNINLNIFDMRTCFVPDSINICLNLKINYSLVINGKKMYFLGFFCTERSLLLVINLLN